MQSASTQMQPHAVDVARGKWCLHSVRGRLSVLEGHVEDLVACRIGSLGEANCGLIRLGGHLHQSLHRRLDLRGDKHLRFAQKQAQMIGTALVHTESTTRQDVQLVEGGENVRVGHIANRAHKSDRVTSAQAFHQVHNLN